MKPTPLPLNAYRDDIHETAIEKGWWENPPELGTSLMLVVTEVAEAMEEHRLGYAPDVVRHLWGAAESAIGVVPKPEGIPTELADVIIRVLDIAGAYNIDIEAAFLEKLAYNRTRTHRHGRKLV